MIFENGGELGALMRSLDWSISPIGYTDAWPPALQTALSIMLPSRHPMFVAWGPELIYLYNDALRPVLGNKHPWALGIPFREVWPEVWNDVRPLVESTLRGEATWSENFPVVLERNGYPEDCWFTFSYSPLRDSSGKITGLFCCAEETTQRVLTEHALIKERERAQNEFRALYERAPGFIATSNGPEHRFTFANASYKQFVGRNELVGMTVAESLPEIADQGFIDLLDQVYLTGETFAGNDVSIEIHNQLNGLTEIRYCNFVYEAVRDSNSTISGVFCAGYDITEGKKVTNKLAEMQSELIHVSRVNAMGTMAATLAHELNQPLAAVANYTAGIRRLANLTTIDDGQLGQALKGIDEASTRAAEIITNLRELTRRREPDRIAFNLNSAVSECLRLVQATIDPRLTIVNNIPDDLAMTADRIQIQQVIINLLRNACEASAAANHRQVTITARQMDQYVNVRVVDTGFGVSAESALSIFEWSDSVKESGMGLGLSICRTIIEAHRGRIWLEASGPEGSEFCFSVPYPSNATP